MTFLTVPLVIILLSILGVIVIVWRKMSYLRKLTPESHEMGETFFHDLAPEVLEWVHGIPLRRYQHTVAVEAEKFLRRIRLVMSWLDRMSDQLVKRIRGAGQRAARQHERSVAEREQKKQEQPEPDPDAVDFDDPATLKQEEQRLIVAIAQNPKDAKLYSDLARISMRLGSYTDAVEAMKQAVKLEPNNGTYAKRLERAKRKLADDQRLAEKTKPDA